MFVSFFESLFFELIWNFFLPNFIRNSSDYPALGSTGEPISISGLFGRCSCCCCCCCCFLKFSCRSFSAHTACRCSLARRSSSARRSRALSIDLFTSSSVNLRFWSQSASSTSFGAPTWIWSFVSSCCTTAIWNKESEKRRIYILNYFWLFVTYKQSKMV